ncbi:MAG: ATPase P, partial [Oscillospiraceae bacterium]|nr:ATPase P [Oscillospiraceae bacterium]
PCGVGQKALYLSSMFLSRRFYVPISAVKRVYKKIAMSKGGFSGQGAFGTIPYIVVEYDNGNKIECTFKFEKNVDLMLAAVQRDHPEIKTMSAQAEKNLKRAKAEEKARLKTDLSPEAVQSIEQIKRARKYLEKRPELSKKLSTASKAKRVNSNARPSYKWVAIAVTFAGIVAAAYGVYEMITKKGSLGIYFTLIGLAFVFMFAGICIKPTAHRNQREVDADLQKARSDMEAYLHDFQDFPLPARYAHPAALTRMIRSIEEGRAENIAQAYEDLKKGLKALNSSVQVSQQEYDEVVAIKPMFLVEDYR